jgi:hypothetical protein
MNNVIEFKPKLTLVERVLKQYDIEYMIENNYLEFRIVSPSNHKRVFVGVYYGETDDMYIVNMAIEESTRYNFLYNDCDFAFTRRTVAEEINGIIEYHNEWITK